MSRDLGCIRPDLGSFGTIINVILEVLVLQVGKNYDAACHVTWEVLGPVWTVGSFAIVIRDTHHIITFHHTLVCFAAQWRVLIYICSLYDQFLRSRLFM